MGKLKWQIMHPWVPNAIKQNIWQVNSLGFTVQFSSHCTAVEGKSDKTQESCIEVGKLYLPLANVTRELEIICELAQISFVSSVCSPPNSLHLVPLSLPAGGC